ncbi:MAG: hypothetical protein GEU83_03120 [Pseudonocardiaceae bacterium]|nr:hypothetical protein [Pseudonocardiaceae bacterium]
MSEVVRRSEAVTAPADVLSDLQRFEAVVLQQLQQVGLPDNRVFVDVTERQVMLNNLPGVLAGLDSDTLGRSHYISKMIAAAAVGLFDAALNYLWDELVGELRRRVSGFDLAYFYDIAGGTSELRKHLKTEEDLSRIDDSSLLRATHEIGLLTDIGFQRLDHVRYMRNHASAAHPNQVELTGLDLAQWLQVCIKQVITTPPDHVTARTGRLLANLKKARLDGAALREAAVFFDQLPTDRADTLGNGLFGLYVDPSRTPASADNIRLLWPELWPFLSEDTRLGYGLRCARAGANLDHGPAAAARELLELVDGVAYLPQELRAAELDAALDTLMAIHNALNNFYNEGAPARQIEVLVGERGDVPTAVARKYTRTLVEVFLGNGYGVSFVAGPIYRRLLEQLEPQEARRALRAFTDVRISSLLWTDSARRQWWALLEILESKLTRRSDRELLAAIRVFPGTPDQLRSDTAIMKLAASGMSPSSP